MRRLGAIETTFWPRARAHRAFCEAEILARAAALIVRRPRVARVLFNPLSALIAVSSAFSCRAALSRSVFNCATMTVTYEQEGDASGGLAVRGYLSEQRSPAQITGIGKTDLSPRCSRKVGR